MSYQARPVILEVWVEYENSRGNLMRVMMSERPHNFHSTLREDLKSIRMALPKKESIEIVSDHVFYFYWNTWEGSPLIINVSNAVEDWKDNSFHPQVCNIRNLHFRTTYASIGSMHPPPILGPPSPVQSISSLPVFRPHPPLPPDAVPSSVSTSISSSAASVPAQGPSSFLPLSGVSSQSSPSAVISPQLLPSGKRKEPENPNSSIGDILANPEKRPRVSNEAVLRTISAPALYGIDGAGPNSDGNMATTASLSSVIPMSRDPRKHPPPLNSSDSALALSPIGGLPSPHNPQHVISGPQPPDSGHREEASSPFVTTESLPDVLHPAVSEAPNSDPKSLASDPTPQPSSPLFSGSDQPAISVLGTATSEPPEIPMQSVTSPTKESDVRNAVPAPLQSVIPFSEAEEKAKSEIFQRAMERGFRAKHELDTANMTIRELETRLSTVTEELSRHQKSLDIVRCDVGIQTDDSETSVVADLSARLATATKEAERQAEIRMRAEEFLLLETQKRRRAEDSLRAVQRECQNPFVVPALLDAFVSIAELTEESLLVREEARPEGSNQ